VIKKKPGNISSQKSEKIFSLFFMPNWRRYFFYLHEGKRRKSIHLLNETLEPWRGIITLNKSLGR